MQSNQNNSIENNKNINKNIIDELLLKNQDVLNKLIIENLNRKEKSFITSTEYEYLRYFENNLVELIERCPTNELNKIICEIDGKVSKDKEDDKNNNNESK